MLLKSGVLWTLSCLLGLNTLYISCVLLLEDEPEAGFHSWTDPSPKYPSYMDSHQYKKPHFPGSLTDPLSLTQSTAPGPCGKSYDALDHRRGASIILTPMLYALPFYHFLSNWVSIGRLSAHWYSMGCKSLAIITKQRIKMTIFFP